MNRTTRYIVKLSIPASSMLILMRTRWLRIMRNGERQKNLELKQGYEVILEYNVSC